jgi:hypothetical protein
MINALIGSVVAMVIGGVIALYGIAIVEAIAIHRRNKRSNQ